MAATRLCTRFSITTFPPDIATRFFQGYRVALQKSLFLREPWNHRIVTLLLIFNYFPIVGISFVSRFLLLEISLCQSSTLTKFFKILEMVPLCYLKLFLFVRRTFTECRGWDTNMNKMQVLHAGDRSGDRKWRRPMLMQRVLVLLEKYDNRRKGQVLWANV